MENYWHQVNKKGKDYHLNKTNLCEAKGIRLLYIWEHEWNNNRLFLKRLITLYLENKVPQNEFQELLEYFNNKLPRDYFSVLYFPKAKIEEPKEEMSGKEIVYKTGYILLT